MVLLIGIVGIVSAQTCKKIVTSKEAVEDYTHTVKTPIMENKVILQNVSDVVKYKSDVSSFRTAWANYQKLTDKSKAVKPVYPKMTIKTIETTIQVQKVIEKTKYKFVFKFPFVESYVLKIPQYTETQETSSRIKSGYFLDEENGNFCLA